MAIGTALLGLLAFLLGCSGTSAEPPNSERFAKRKVRCGVAGRGSRPPSWKAPATGLCAEAAASSGLVAPGPVALSAGGSESPTDRAFAPLPRLRQAAAGAAALARWANGRAIRPRGAIPGAVWQAPRPTGLWDGPPLPAPPGVGSPGDRARGRSGSFQIPGENGVSAASLSTCWTAWLGQRRDLLPSPPPSFSAS